VENSDGALVGVVSVTDVDGWQRDREHQRTQLLCQGMGGSGQPR
jgi:hypothetical protein